MNNLIITEEVRTNNITIKAGDYAKFEINITKNGYTPIGIVGFIMPNQNIFSFEYNIKSSDVAVVYLKNTYTSTYENTHMSIFVLYVKNI